ncbi:hypothetical protein OL239_08260 [Arthrobacter sp. ATA002]|uniref:hypothetical protein n=1 Tax=Arthrobacter sp. ATA002 TaxID=2991715 RepID=UPI0022A6B05C|nr:hypothetical protein [Arthrobacter sp. ATA002]WAP53064.1 hypothetical protein OL239_08260 [Arthrobacter sp. ATA002]
MDVEPGTISGSDRGPVPDSRRREAAASPPIREAQLSMNDSAPSHPAGSHRAAGAAGEQQPGEHPPRGGSAGRTVWARFLIPVALIVLWFGAGAIGGPYFGKISEVADNNQTSYLPSSSASTQVAELQEKFTDSDAIPAVIVYVNDGGLTEQDRSFIDGRVPALSEVNGVAGGVSPAQISTDGQAAELCAGPGQRQRLHHGGGPAHRRHGRNSRRAGGLRHRAGRAACRHQ